MTDVYTPEGVRRIMGWFAEVQEYEDNGKWRGGSGLRRPIDLVLDGEFVSVRDLAQERKQVSRRLIGIRIERHRPRTSS